MWDTLERLEALAASGEEEKAQEELSRLETREVRDAAFHLRLADLCEDLRDHSRLVLELSLAFRDAPDDLDILRRLGHLHADTGATELSLKCWRKVVEREPGDSEAWEEVVYLLSSTHRADEARQACREAFAATGEARFQARERAIGGESRDTADASLPEEPSEAAVACFHALFAGRDGVYARQWGTTGGTCGYGPIHEPFTLQVARNHMLGNHTVGIYPIRHDNAVNFAALDFDLPGWAQKCAEGTAERSRATEALRRHALKVKALAEEHGLSPVLEDSGSKGFHLWLFFEEPLPAQFARRLGQALVRLAGGPADRATVEVFPKQSHLPADKIGNLIKLPLGIHRKTGRRAVFLDGEGRPAADQQAFLLGIRRQPRAVVMEFLERVAPRVEEEEALPWERDEEAPLRAPEPEYALEDDDTLQLLLARCPTLSELVRRAATENQLTNDEVVVLQYTVGHLDTGPQAVNSVLRKCPGVGPSFYLKSRHSGNPVSCPKIRKRLPHITSQVPCNCIFDETGGYPHPLRHLERRSGLGPGERPQLQLNHLVQEFLKARRALHLAEKSYRRCVEELQERFEQAGLEELATPFGTLRRLQGPDGETTFELRV